jgi:hypothetical protein
MRQSQAPQDQSPITIFSENQKNLREAGLDGLAAGGILKDFTRQESQTTSQTQVANEPQIIRFGRSARKGKAQ